MRGAGNYILKEKDQNAVEKVAWAKAANCFSSDPHLAIREAEITQQGNDSKNNTLHLVVSFPDGESPGHDQLEKIEDGIIKALGLEEHQRLVAMHSNTENDHLHLVVNLVHPQKMTLASTWQNKSKCQEVAIKLEKELGLAPTPHSTERRPERENPRVQRFEIQTGHESLATWAKREAAPTLRAEVRREGATWETLHQVASKFNLQMVREGQGIVFSDAKGKATAKASDIHRELSLKNIEKALGEFKPGQQQKKLATAQVDAKEYNPTAPSEGIPMDATQKQDAARTQIRASRADARAKTEAEYRTSRELVMAETRERIAGMGYERTAENVKAITTERDKKLRALKEQRDVNRNAINQAMPLPPVLTKKERTKRRDGGRPTKENGMGFGMEPGDGSGKRMEWTPTARNIPPFEAVAVKGGTVVEYRDAVGAVAFLDTGTRIQVIAETDKEVIRAALLLASEKWGEVRVHGDDAYKRLVAMVAAEEGIAVKNPEMQGWIEKARGGLEREAARQEPIKTAQEEQQKPQQEMDFSR